MIRNMTAPRMTTDQLRQDNLAKRAVLILLISLMVGCPACESPRPSDSTPKPKTTTRPGAAIVRGVVGVPRHILGAVTDPTGARALSAKLEKETDIEAFNQAVREIRDSAALLKERIAAVPPDIGQTIAAQVRGAELELLSARLTELVNAARQGVDNLNTTTLNEVVAEARSAITATRQRITEIDITALNETIREIRGKVSEINVSTANTAVADANSTMTRTRLPLHLSLWLVALLLVLLNICAAVWLFRQLYRSRVA